ncbi:lysophospholipase L1-like esterase [Streptomyces sp. LBL]|uniref:SGNH/GDSL hydrolase family protein n=1 Tax=Streptomyces sp. LBL TaxID=2940562 RepID=UPI00247347E9|nr:SGNH/GDSL hydrolase family protein [Streptomyces sp. LBL]MDH6626028.1 lysophospholipase L1-like esterase [Streptomyces sp. LBL]
MRPLRFVALGDSLTEGVGDPVGDGWRGWAALLADGIAEGGVVSEGPADSRGSVVSDGSVELLGSVVSEGPVEPMGSVESLETVEFTNLAVSGSQSRDVLERQLPAALALRPDVASVVIGVNDTLRCTFDIQAVAARLDTVYSAFTEQGAVLLTACLPDPGAMLGLPGALARPLARRQRAVNAVVHALSERYGAVHLHACEGAWLTDRAMWSADRLHPGERGHRQLAVRFHALLAERGLATGAAPLPEPGFPAPTRSASVWWLATAGTGWVARRCTDLLPQLLTLAVDEMRHHARGTSARLDLRTSAAVSAALAALSVGEQQPDAA